MYIGAMININHLLFYLKDMLVEMLLQRFVGVIDAALIEEKYCGPDSAACPLAVVRSICPLKINF